MGANVRTGSYNRGLAFAVLGTLAAVMAVSVIVVTGIEIVALFACGHGVGVANTLAGFSFIFGDTAMLDTAGCEVPRVPVFVVTVVIVTILGIVLAFGLITWSAYQQSNKKFVTDILRREGIAKAREVRTAFGPESAVARGKTIRPSVKHPNASDVALCLGKSQGVPVWFTLEESVALIGPPRSGKGFYIIVNDILDAPGAVITTSTRADNYAMTSELRAEIGPIALFDPQGLTGLGTTLRWSVSQGCADPKIAARRAKVLMDASGMGQSSTNQEWAQISRQLLMYLLHAAELGGVDARTLAGWGSEAAAAMPAVEILEADPRAVPGWGRYLRAVVESDKKDAMSRWMGVGNALEPLLLPSIAEVLTPARPEDVLDPKVFIEQKGTLYLIGTREGSGAIAPLLIALLDEVTAVAREMAVRSPGNRLDPPLLLELDEIANLATWPGLVQIMADGGGSGISARAVLQSVAQARGNWGEQQAQAIFDAATVRIQLGGAGNDKDLQQFEALLGVRQVTTVNRSWAETSGVSKSETRTDKALLSVAEMRRLPTGFALVLGRNGRPMIVRMNRWIERDDADDIKAALARYSQSAFHELTDIVGDDFADEVAA